MRQWKFHDKLEYDNMHKIDHHGQLGFKTNQNIVCHVVTMLDDNAKYRIINGKVHVKDIYSHKNGKYKKRQDFIPLEEHNRQHFPKLKNPSIL